MICYVGIRDDVEYKFHEHLSCLRTKRQEKSWIRELQGLGLSPILRILETIETSGNESALARERECYWVEEVLRLGYPLLNFFW